MAVEGAEGSAVAALGGGIEELGTEVEEVTEEVMSDTMLGAYFFAYLKNPSISERGRKRKIQSYPSPPLCHATGQERSPLLHRVSPMCASRQAQDLQQRQMPQGVF
jgi:hypothetical protein